MRIDVLTLFPEMFQAVLDNSIIGRAKEKGILLVPYDLSRDVTIEYVEDKDSVASQG